MNEIALILDFIGFDMYVFLVSFGYKIYFKMVNEGINLQSIGE